MDCVIKVSSLWGCEKKLPLALFPIYPYIWQYVACKQIVGAHLPEYLRR